MMNDTAGFDGGDNNPAIVLENVSFSRRKGRRRIEVLSGISGSFAARSRTVIVGRSGEGKSTIFDLIAGIALPDSGRVELCGRTISELNENERASLRLEHIGFVRQDFDLIRTLTAVENVEIPLRLRGVARAEARERAHAALNRLSLSRRVDHLPRELSGGEQQRVALARAVVGEPSVVLADEPTGSLDTGLRDEALDALIEAVGERTLVVVTHDDAVAERIRAQRRRLIEGALGEPE